VYIANYYGGRLTVIDGFSNKVVAMQVGLILHRLANAVIGIDIVGCRLGAEQETIADILFEEAFTVMAADHRVGEVQILDHGLELASMTTGDAATEDYREFVGLTDAAIGVKEPLLEGIDGRATTEDEVVAVHLGKKQPVLDASLLSLLGSEKESEVGQPLLATTPPTLYTGP
jgi:hypothetical protein